MLQYSYNNIIISVTNVIILENLSFTILFFQHKLEYKNNES